MARFPQNTQNTTKKQVEHEDATDIQKKKDFVRYILSTIA